MNDSNTLARPHLEDLWVCKNGFEEVHVAAQEECVDHIVHIACMTMIYTCLFGI